jgi:2-iminobutanoate/2-iminopropanoate deaminase
MPALAHPGPLCHASGSVTPATGETTVPRQIIATPDAPSSPLYSQAVKAGPSIVVSGMVGIDPGTKSLAGVTIQAQTRQALANCEAVLRAGGATLDDVVEVGVLLARPADFAGLNEEYAQWFTAEPPARYVAALGVDLPGVLVSIRMTASVD